MIHDSDPFATPESQRSEVRRLRGRLGSTVCLWTAPGPAGLTVSSTLVADGEPGRVLGLIDDESELWPAVQAAGVFAVTILGEESKQLADRFAGLMPAPGGLFRQGESWVDTDYGKVLPDATWAGCELADARPVGYGLLVEGVIRTITLNQAQPPLVHHRGSYAGLRTR